MVSATVFINLMLASVALAAPSLEARLPRRAPAAAGLDSSTTKYLVERTLVPYVGLNDTFAGAVYINENDTFYAVSAVVIPPNFTSGSVNIWLGLDGFGCSNVAFHTGLKMSPGGNVEAWYQWYPNRPRSFPSFLTINPGDFVNMTISTVSDHVGVAMIQNVVTGQSVSQGFVFPAASYRLCRSEAMWWASWEGPLADFDKITFFDAQTTVISGPPVGPNEPAYQVQLMDIPTSRHLTYTTAEPWGTDLVIQHA